MPTPRYHGGAQLQVIPLTLPGFKGLNKQQSTALLGPEWATSLQNAVIDDNNRVAARKGFSSQTSSAIPHEILQVQEYTQHDGTTSLIAAVDDGTATLWESTDDGDTWSDITGGTITVRNMQLINFNDDIFGIQGSGGTILKYNSADATFSDVADANAPDGRVAVAAWGRLWVTDSDDTQIKVSGLLDAVDWTTTGTSITAATIDLTNVWPDTDTIKALAVSNNRLVVFGERNIILIQDPEGTELGVDVTKMQVVDTLSGIGCLGRELVQNVEGDLWFISSQGLHSLGRAIQEVSNPLDNIAPQVQDFIRDLVEQDDTDLTRARSFYSPKDRFFLLSLPKELGGLSQEFGQAVIFDTRARLEDGAVRCMGTWNSLVPTSGFIKQDDKEFYFSLFEQEGELGKFGGYNDGAGVSYAFEYESGWIDITGGSGYLIIPKRIEGLLFLEATANINFKWAFDFETSFLSQTINFIGAIGVSEYGEGEWGEAEYGGGAQLRQGKVAGRGTGEFIKLALSTAINGAPVSIQQLDIFAKLGRYK